MPHDLSFEVFTQDDIPEMTGVMTRAFDDDAQRHLGKPRGGPEGYDNGDFFRQWLFQYDVTHGFKVLHQGKAIGGITVWVLPDGHNILGTIFVDPAYQDRGVGSRLWHFVEETYPQTHSWRLATPIWATKNHGFYAKLGFKHVGRDALPDVPEDCYVYQKDMPEPAAGS